MNQEKGASVVWSIFFFILKRNRAMLTWPVVLYVFAAPGNILGVITISLPHFQPRADLQNQNLHLLLLRVMLI